MRRVRIELFWAGGWSHSVVAGTGKAVNSGFKQSLLKKQYVKDEPKTLKAVSEIITG